MLEKKYHCMRSFFALISLETWAETHSSSLGARGGGGGFEVMLNMVIQVYPTSWEPLFGKVPPLRDTDGRGNVQDRGNY